MSSDNVLLSDLLARAEEAADADTEDFGRLVEILGLDPKTDFAEADLADLEFRREEFQGCDFRGADFSRATFSGCLFDSCDFRGAVLDGARFDHAALHSCDFSHAFLRDITVEGSPVGNCRFFGADLTNAYFVKSPLNKLDLKDAILKDATFVDSPIQATDIKVVGDAQGSNLVAAANAYESELALSDGLILSAGIAPHRLEDKDVRGILFGLGKWGQSLARAVERQALPLGYKTGDPQEARHLGVPCIVLADDRDRQPTVPLWQGEADQIIFSCGRTGALPKFIQGHQPIILIPRQNAEAHAAPPPLRPADQVTRALEVLQVADTQPERGRITLLSTVTYHDTPADVGATALKRALLQAAVSGFAWEDAVAGQIQISTALGPRAYLEGSRLRHHLKQYRTTYQARASLDRDIDSLTVVAWFNGPRPRRERPSLEEALAPPDPDRNDTFVERYRLEVAEAPDSPVASPGSVLASFIRTFPTAAALRGLEEDYYVIDPALLVLLQGGAYEFQKRFAVWSSMTGRARKEALSSTIMDALRQALRTRTEDFDIFSSHVLHALHEGAEGILFLDFNTRRHRSGRALRCTGDATFECAAHSLVWDFSFNITIDMDYGITVTDIAERSRLSHDA